MGPNWSCCRARSLLEAVGASFSSGSAFLGYGVPLLAVLFWMAMSTGRGTLCCSGSGTWLTSWCLLLPSKTRVCNANNYFLPLLKGREVLGHHQVEAVHFRGGMNPWHLCTSSSEPGQPPGAALHGVTGCLSRWRHPRGSALAVS